MTKKSEALTISCSAEQRKRLETIAERYELNWGGKPNISQLIRLIADGTIPVGEIEPVRRMKPVLAAVKQSLLKAIDDLNKIEPNEN